MMSNFNFIKKISYSLLFVFVVSSCTSDFEEINKNQTGLTGDRFEEDLLFTRSLVYGALRYTEYQRAQQLYAQHYMQYYAVSVSYFPTGRYITRNDWLTAYWREAYSDFGMQNQQAIELTENDPIKANKNSIAKIWKIFIMHRITDFWGDVPYFDAFNGNIVPTYTPQSEIYYDMIAVLEREATSLANTNGESYGSSDVIYQGDKNLWIKFANSLRLRLAMRLSNVDASFAQQQVSELVAENNFINNNQESALMRYGIGFGNATENIQPMSILRNFNEYRAANTLVDFLKNNDDPRLELFIEPNEDGDFVGLQNGLNPEQISAFNLAKFSRESNIISNQSSATGLITYPEILFLKSEAALRGWIPESSEQLYNDGIKASINYWNDTYSNFKNILPNDQADALPTINIDDTVINIYLNSPEIVYNPSKALEQIITQKWVALINQGFESYAEYRRTGFPILNPIPNTNGESETGGSNLPVRVRYPAEEQSLNRNAYEAAIQRQGPDLPTTNIWWDVN